MRFLIQGPTGPGGEPGPQYEQSSVDYFLAEWAPKGYTIVASPPTGYDVPDVDVPNPQEMTRAELNEFALTAGVVDPEKLPSKAALLEAIETAQNPAPPEPPQETTTTTTTPAPEG